MQEQESGLSWVAIVAERRIEEAIELGQFDNLPGKGKPLKLDDDTLTPPHLRAAHRVLKNASISPEWVGLEGEIYQAKTDAESFLELMYAKLSGASASSIADARGEYERLLRSANNLILRYNYVNPFVHRAPIPFRIKLRLQEWDNRFHGNSPDATDE